MSMWRPLPVRPRSISAARMLLYAYMPAAMSAMEAPALLGSSGVPVTETKPASLWIRRS
jgi:hypothetical protein